MTVRSQRGFTVLEVFAVVVLLATLFALAASNIDFSASRWSVRPARESLIRAVGDAHNYSRLQKEDLFMRYDRVANALVIEDVRGSEIQRVPLAKGEVSEIKFYRVLPEKERGESPAYEPEDEPVSQIVFSPSGSATPMIIEIDTERGRNSLLFDPFSLRLIQDTVN